MSILTLIVGVVLAIVILWAVNTYLPHPIRLILNIVVIVVLLVVLLSVFGVLGPLSRTDRSAPVRWARLRGHFETTRSILGN